MATATVEDYVKQIYLLELEEPRRALVPMGALAEALSVVPGTATVMVKRLARDGFVRYEPYGGVLLLERGRSLALGVLRRHRLVESFLVDVLGLDWSEVHEEAERLEHAISQKLLDAIDRKLGFPTVDPHGDPIPSGAGDVVDSGATALWSAEAGTSGTITRVCSQEEPFLRFVAAQGLRPGVGFVVAAVDRDAETVTIEPERGESVVLGRAAAAKLMIQRDEPSRRN